MGRGISEILPFAIGVAISPIPIIAVILMLFSNRAKVNGPVFLLGWVIGLSVVVAVVYGIAHAANVATDSTSSDTISWIKVGLGCGAAGRGAVASTRAAGAGAKRRRCRSGWPRSTTSSPEPRSCSRIVLLGGEPEEPHPRRGARRRGRGSERSVGDAVVALIVFVVIASLSVGGAVAYHLFGGQKAHVDLNDLKSWLTSTTIRR